METAGGTGAGVVAGAGIFYCCVQSAILLIKWSKPQGKIAMDGNFRKLWAGCPVASDPFGLMIPARFISKI